MLEYAKLRIVAVFAHPDDEAYSCAGLLAMAAAGGAVVTVVAATRGEAGRDREGVVPPGPTLAKLRTVELGLSCRALGIQPPIFLDLPDGGLADNLELEFRMKDVFARLKPNVVVTLGEDGAYGHTDHLAVTDAVVRLIQDMPKKKRPRLLFAQFPKGLFEKVRAFMNKAMPRMVGTGTTEVRAARERTAEAVLQPGTATQPTGTTRTTGIDPADADIILDIRPWRGRKLNALAAHRSQLKVGDPNSFLVPGLAESLLDRELYTCPAGPALPRGAVTPLDGIEVP